MKDMRKFLLICLACIMACFSGCASSRERLVKHRNEAVSVAAYGIKRSLDAGRFDLAKKYSDSLTKMVAPPAKEANISPVYVKNPASGAKEKSIVLPPAFRSDVRVIVRDTPEFEKITIEQPEIKKQIAEEERAAEKFNKQVDSVVRETEKLALKPETKKTGWGWVWGIVTGGGILGIIALCVFMPAAIPFIQAIGSWFATVFTTIVRWLTSLWVKK